MKRAFVRAAAAAAAFLAVAAVAGEHGSRLPPNDTYRDECGGCHVAFPPALLPAESWQRLMTDLPHHFGSDASLEPATRDALAAWLKSHANRRALAAPPDDRITKGTWFVREHRKVATDAWQRTSVKSPSNCTACHGGAATGDYDEHAVRIPR